MRLKILFAVSFSILGCSLESKAQLPDWRQQVPVVVSDYMKNHNVPGLTVGIHSNHGSDWVQGFGMSDIENQVSAKPETMYQLASVSKSITAVAALKLNQDGKLDFHVPIQTYCPQFPRKELPITTWQLMLHTSGIRHYNETEQYNAVHYPDIVSTFKRFKDDPLVSMPGEKFSYTSYGYNVLGCVIEGASGLSFMDYVTKNVFIPANMTHARQDSDRDIIANRSAGYERSNEGLVVAGIYDTSITIPGGGIMSTAGDLLHFGQALFAKKLLSEQSLAVAFKGYLEVPEANAAIGPGWGVTTYNGREIFVSTGSNPKVSTILFMIPSANLVISILGNVSEENFFPLAKQISDLVLN